ncbi:hypothetical protein B0A49_13854, partial [Cryomyces minteri]
LSSQGLPPLFRLPEGAHRKRAVSQEGAERARPDGGHGDGGPGGAGRRAGARAVGRAAHAAWV